MSVSKICKLLISPHQAHSCDQYQGWIMGLLGMLMMNRQCDQIVAQAFRKLPKRSDNCLPI